MASNGAAVAPQKSGAAGQNFATKMSESQRKVEDRPSQPRAWTSGVNPITQRSNTTTIANGAPAKSTNGSDKTPKDRQPWLFNNAVGLECIVTMKNGERFTGVFAGSQNQKLAFMMAKELAREGPVDTSGTRAGAYMGAGDNHVRVVSTNVVELFEVPQAVPVAKVTTNGASSGFRTDTDISGNLAGRERNLQRWEAPSGQDVDMSLESSSTGGWDQFKANEERFGLRSDYDENIYTTTIDRQNPQYAKRAMEADRIAREIEGSASNNAHMREERGLADEGQDEEEKYSGVARAIPTLQSNQPNRYIPPSKRGTTQTGQPATSNSIPAGPIDPAIISAQIARPEASDKKTISAQPQGTLSAGITTKGATAVPTLDGKTAKAPGKTATDNVETELLESFRQFSAGEKMKLHEHKRSRAHQDKTVKMNDLKKFSQNFKLLTPVPKDLVPILAKDETKQKEIVQKAQANAESKPAKATSATTDQKPSRLLAAARWDNDGAAASVNSTSRTRQTSGSAASSQKENNAVTAPREVSQTVRGPPTSLSTRLDSNHRAYIAGVPAPIPKAIPIPIPDNRNKGGRNGFQAGQPSPQKSSIGRGPPSATSQKFNVKAMEFNPNANAFKPTVGPSTVVSSPRSGPATRAISPAAPPPSMLKRRTDFSGTADKSPSASVLGMPAVPNFSTGNNPQLAKTSFEKNGGYPAAFQTGPTWYVEDIDNGPDHKMLYFERPESRRLTNPQPQASPSAALAHQHQLPYHLQQGIHGTPAHPPQHNNNQPHQQHHFNHGHHFEDNHMRPSASQSSYAPSPRMQNQNSNYQSPMPPNAQLAYPPHMQYPGQGHSMGPRQFSNPPPQMMPVQGSHLAPMMMPQSQAGYPQQMGMPFQPQGMPMYPNSGPHQMYGSPGQAPSGYPSPGRGAPMMVHQGSQQGQQPIYMPQQPGQYGQPVYAQQPTHMRNGYGSPQPPFIQNSYPQPQHFQHQPHRTPSSGYAQPHQPQHQQHQPQQGPPPPTGPMDTADQPK